ncbi:MAG: anti-sigma regulatory factor [Clostridia bacterium]|nr:anti-sigma regulatory factor [Clostridia bacterium]
MCYRFNIESLNFQAAGTAAMKIKRNLLDIGYDPMIARRAAIIAYELEMNLVIHGGGGLLEVKMSPKAIEISARDEGPGIPDVNLAMQEGYSTAPPQVREMGFGAGMGLPNIKHWADVLDIQSKVGEGTSLKAIIYCFPSEWVS